MTDATRHPVWCDRALCTAFADPDRTADSFHFSTPRRVEQPNRLGYPQVEVFLRLDTCEPVDEEPTIWIRLSRTDAESVEAYELTAGQVSDLAAALADVLTAFEGR